MEHAVAPDLRIVEADLADAGQAAAVTGLLDEYARGVMGGREGLSETVREDLISGLRAHPTSIVLLAYDGDRPVGIAVCFVGFSTFTARKVVNVHDLAVTSDARRQGVGSRLLEAVEGKARQLNCSKITLEVYEDNFPARQLYRRAGFASGDDGHGKGGVPSLFLVKRLP